MRMRRRSLPPLTLLVLLALAGGCRSTYHKQEIPSRFTPEEVPAAIEASRADLAAGRAEVALERLRSAKSTRDLPPEVRQEIQMEIERTAAVVIRETEEPARLRDMMDVDIPRTMAVEAGMRAAELLYAEGERLEAFRLIERLDAKFPQHPQRAAAGALLSEIGHSLAWDPRRYLLFFTYRGHAPQVLEYLAINYPSDPHGPQALWTLADLYTKSHNFELAIEKHQNLILWFPDDPRVVGSQACIPHLRLAALGSPEYDRSELVLAQSELEAWLDDHAGHSLESVVRADLADCLGRLADNDLAVARFYRRVKNSDGAEYHARRALETARTGGDEDQIAEAVALMESLAPGDEE